MCHYGNLIKSATLRVYSPDAASSTEPVPGFVRGYGILLQGQPRADLTLDWEGQRLICPSNLRLRVLESTVAFSNSFRGMGAGLIPEDAARAAASELKTYHWAHPTHRSHILTSAWHVPVRWFAGFHPDDQEIYEGESGISIRFRTPISHMRQRVDHTLNVLGRVGGFDAPAEELGRLAEWLGPFDDGSLVELDYGRVATLFEAADLVVDDTCELVHESVAALEKGDMLRAGECYGKVVARWAHAFSLSFSN